jgi:hypothetical protein
MSNFAKLDENNIVIQVIVAEKDFINTGAVGDEFLWIQTSYNNNFRGKYAGIGDTWDKVNEVFISPKPYSSWSLDDSFEWQAPTPYPEDELLYYWSEDNLAWVLQD